jgi:hypothetical protein
MGPRLEGKREEDENMKEPLHYLASPYSHPDAWVREARFRAVSRVAGLLFIEQEVRTFAPIALGTPVEYALASRLDEPLLGLDHKFWEDWDGPFKELCTDLIITMLPGWNTSTGVAEETAWFKRRDRPVAHLGVRHWFTDAEWRILEAGTDG